RRARPAASPTRCSRGPHRRSLTALSPRSARDLGEMLGERARSPLVSEDAHSVDGALEHRARERRQLRALDEEHRVLLRGEGVHDLALAELTLDALLVVGFDDDPWSVLHDEPPSLQL